MSASGPFSPLVVKIYQEIKKVHAFEINNKKTMIKGGGCLLVSCVMMREKKIHNKKTMIKVTFFELNSAQRCHHLW